MKRPRSSIGLQLFVGTFAAIVAVFLAFSWFSARETSEAWQSSFEEHATQTTAVIERVLRQGMLLRNKEAVHAALRDVASAPGIRSIRIYDKKGKIRFSTDARDIGTEVERGAEACAICHGAPFHTAHDESFTRVLRVDGAPIMGQTRLIKNEEKCAGAKCHAPPTEKVFLGVMDFQTSMVAVDQATRSARKTTFWAAIVMLVVGGLATLLIIQRFVRRPVVELVKATRAVAEGNLETRLELGHAAEFHDLSTAFNHMTADLAAARERQQKWEESLARAIEQKTADLATAHRRMAHMEKMASLGKLAAMVAHEINNPLAGILVYAKLLKRELATEQLAEADRVEALRYVDVVQRESARCGDIVKNLLSFARQSRTAFTEQSVNTIVDRSLMTVAHLFRHNSVETMIEAMEGDDKVLCDPSEIQQALVALLVNASEAMPNGGKLRMRVEPLEDDRIVVAVIDSGAGIPDDVLPQIFEPFFSTKGDEKGVGLGLAAVYGIVRRHEATIDVESQIGKGTTFKLTLKRRPEVKAAVSTAPGANGEVPSSRGEKS
jgi:two-component system NtrC family sensor kinase